MNSNDRFVPNDAPDQITIAGIINSVAEHWRLSLTAGIAVFVIAIAYAFLVPPTYVGDALIQIEEKKGTNLPGMQQLATALDVTQSPVPGEVEIIRSREVMEQAIDALHLTINVRPKHIAPYFFYQRSRKIFADDLNAGVSAPPWLSGIAWGGERAVVTVFNIPAKHLGERFSLISVDESHWKLRDPAGTEIAGGVVGVLTDFDSHGISGSILVQAISARPNFEFLLVNEPKVKTYNRVFDSLKVAESAKLSNVVKISAESSDRGKAVDLVNEIAKAYLRQNVSRLSEEAEKSLEFLNQQLPDLERQVEAADAALSKYQGSKQSINLDKESESLLTRSVDLEKQRVQLQMREQELAQRFQPGHPEVQALSNQLAGLKKDEADIAGEIKRLPETEQEYLRLDRDVKVNTDLYISLLNNAQQLKIAKAGTVGNVRIIDFAIEPDEPAKPKRAVVLGLGAVLSMFVGMLAALIARAVRPTIRNAAEVEAYSALPLYAIVPESDSQKTLSKRRKHGKREYRLLLKYDPSDPAIEALRSMRTGLQFALVGQPSKLIVITGPLPELGKTFISCNLGAVLASGGQKVVLVDADMRRPKIADAFGLHRSPGLSDYLSEKSEIDQIIHVNVEQNLDVIAAGMIPPNPAELLMRSRFSEMLEFLQARYDYVILDTPPLLPVGDTLAIARFPSAVFLVLRADKSSLKQYGDALRRLETAGIPVKGAILNGVRRKVLGYGNDYYYRYVPAKL